MEALADILKREMAWYAGRDVDIHLHLLSNELDRVYAVNRVIPSRRWPTEVVVMAHVTGDYIVIDDDRTDKPLVDRLVAAGVPRSKIILAYGGEPLPDLA